MSNEQAPICPECGQASVLTNGGEIYPKRHDLHEKSFWICRPCDAYVGCHPGTSRALGTPANKALRLLRSDAHAYLDPLWSKKKLNADTKPLFDSRSAAYKWLGSEMDLTPEKCHIGMMDSAQAQNAINILSETAFKYTSAGREATLDWIKARLQVKIDASKAQVKKYIHNPLWATW